MILTSPAISFKELYVVLQLILFIVGKSINYNQSIDYLLNQNGKQMACFFLPTEQMC